MYIYIETERERERERNRGFELRNTLNVPRLSFLKDDLIYSNKERFLTHLLCLQTH